MVLQNRRVPPRKETRARRLMSIGDVNRAEGRGAMSSVTSFRSLVRIRLTQGCRRIRDRSGSAISSGAISGVPIVLSHHRDAKSKE